MSQFRITENDDRESYLDYTLDKSNLLVRKEIPSHETSRFNEIEENEQEKVDSKNNSNDMITDTMIYNSNKDDDSGKHWSIFLSHSKLTKSPNLIRIL